MNAVCKAALRAAAAFCPPQEPGFWRSNLSTAGKFLQKIARVAFVVNKSPSRKTVGGHDGNRFYQNARAKFLRCGTRPAKNRASQMQSLLVPDCLFHRRQQQPLRTWQNTN